MQDKLFDTGFTIFVLFVLGCYFILNPDNPTSRSLSIRPGGKGPEDRIYDPKKVSEFWGFGLWGIGVCCIPCFLAEMFQCNWLLIFTPILLVGGLAICHYVESHGYLK